MKANILPIAMKGAPVLRQRAVEISALDAEILQLAEDMNRTMHEAQGIGLAANQVGVAKRIIVIDTRSARDQVSTMTMKSGEQVINNWMPLVLINPVIHKVDAPWAFKIEGCLSQPGVTGKVGRPISIEVSGMDDSGNQLYFTATGMLARVIQHEVDHLDGILFTDRIAQQNATKL
jgi:peptide deformylase